MYCLQKMPDNLSDPFFEYIFRDLAFWFKFHWILFLRANWQGVGISSGASSAASHCLDQRWNSLPIVCASVGSDGFKILSFIIAISISRSSVKHIRRVCLLCIVSSMLVISCIFVFFISLVSLRWTLKRLHPFALNYFKCKTGPIQNFAS